MIEGLHDDHDAAAVGLGQKQHAADHRAQALELLQVGAEHFTVGVQVADFRQGDLRLRGHLEAGMVGQMIVE